MQPAKGPTIHSPSWSGDESTDSTLSQRRIQESLWKTEGKNANRSPPTRFRILNRLEKKGAEARLTELQHRLQQTYTAENKIALLQTQLCLMESCFQAAKDQLQDACGEVQQREGCIALLKKEVAEGQAQKRARDEQYSELEDDSKSKIRKLADLEAEKNKFMESLKQQQDLYDQTIETLAKQEIEIHKSKTKWQREVDQQKLQLAAFEDKFRTLETAQVQSAEALKQKEEAYVQLMRAKKAKELLLSDAQKQIEQLEQVLAESFQNLAEVKKNLEEKEAEIAQLRMHEAKHEKLAEKIKLILEEMESPNTFPNINKILEI